MKLTKYEHACFTVEKDGKLLIVDPGGFTTDLGSPENVVAIVVTHEHADHFDVAALRAITAHNLDAVIYAHQDITRQLDNALPHHTVAARDSLTVGPFELEFFGGTHATIHPAIPAVANLGVMINETIYYPGDSFTVPSKPIDTLALPVTAPWLKMSEVFNYLLEVKPRLVFPTHDAIASDAGKQLADSLTTIFAKKVDAQYERLQESIEL